MAIQVANRMSRTLKVDIKVIDVFRLRTIERIFNDALSNDLKTFRLLELFEPLYRPGLADMIFVHPAGGGAEVYQKLAGALTGRYNCIGIENYNMHNEDKIDSLSRLADHYLSEYEQRYKIKEPVSLLGWSLGGQIALEMAAVLESRGYTDINVILLDTILPDETILSFREEDEVNKEENIIEGRKWMIDRRFDHGFIEKIIATMDTDQQLQNSPVSSDLKKARVVLFKATRKMDEAIAAKGDHTYLQNYIQQLRANNVDRIAENLEVIRMDCDHHGIVEEVHSKKIADFLDKKL